jgi:hypothetical protein
VRIRFEGLCGFATRGTPGNEFVEVSLPNGSTPNGPLHQHHALLSIPAAHADPSPNVTTWNPDYVILTPNQDVLCVWNITGTILSAQSTDAFQPLPVTNSNVPGGPIALDFTALHPGSTPNPNPNRGLLTISGGAFSWHASRHAPVVDIVEDTNAGQERTHNVRLFDQVIWDGGKDSTIIATNRGSIGFRYVPGSAGLEMTLCNSAGHAGTGLDHAACYYPLFTRPANMPAIRLRPTQDKNAGPFIDLGWNCVPPGVTP